MSPNGFFEHLIEWFTVQFPQFLGAIAILVVGWLVALILASIVRGAFRRTQAGAKLARWIKGDEEATGTEVNKWSGRIMFYLVMFFVLVAFFQFLDLTFIAEPLTAFLTRIFEYAPRIFGAAILILVAWLVATILRIIVYRILEATKIDERYTDLSGDEKERKLQLSQSLSNVVFWVTFLLFVPAILSTLTLEGLLVPVQGMFEVVLSYLPNIFGAALIILLGWLGARILQRIVANLLSAVGLDRLGEREDVSSYFGTRKPSEILGLLVYVVVVVFAIIGALNALALEAITRPASNMLEMILEALPAVFAAAVVLGIALMVGRVVAGLVNKLLTAIGFDEFLTRMGIARSTTEGARSPSEIAGYVVLVAIMLFASIEAAGLLGFAVLADLIAKLTVLLGRVVVSVVIFGIGLYLGGLAKEVVQTSGGPHADFLAKLARLAILVLAGSIALQQLGVANEIIVIAFGILVGAIALTGVIAFGLGGRDLAARELSEWVENFKKQE
ncbi:MAG: mechanosensitive ion channel [Bacillota bacterium]